MGGLLTSKKISIGKFPANSEIVIPGLAGSADQLPTSPSSHDDEFEQFTSGAPAGWTSFGSPDTIDTNTARSLLHLKTASNGGSDSIKGVIRAAGASIPYTVTAKIVGGSIKQWANYASIGFFIADAITTDKVLFQVITTNGGVKINVGVYYSNWTTYGGHNADSDAAAQVAPVYFKAVVHAANNIDFYYSFDGLSWNPVAAGISDLANATHVGFALDAYSEASEMYVDWIRFS